MSKGESGRIVLEVEPSLKRDLYAALSKDQRTLKSWFLEAAAEYIRAQIQPRLFPDPKKPDDLP